MKEQSKRVLLIMACEAHTEAVMTILDESRVQDWMVVPTLQARREGKLQYMPPTSERSCNLVYAMADPEVIEETVGALRETIHEKELCPNCVAYAWPAEAALELRVAVDPVCRMSVDPRQAPALVHKGKRYFFCSNECLERFKSDPQAFAGQA